MSRLLIHPTVQRVVDGFKCNPPHACLLVGLRGTGKGSIARLVAASMLEITEDTLDNYPYLSVIKPTEKKIIPIDTIREMQHLLHLKIPFNKSVGRVIIIEDAHTMPVEAQNALLKNLEEPPNDTVFILTASSTESLLPTILSRVASIRIIPPDLQDLRQYLSDEYAAEEVDKALLISGGLPGLSVAILSSEEDHPLYEATKQARTLLSAKPYERLLAVDPLSKQKDLCGDILYILGQMSRMALTKNPSMPSAASERWSRILSASFKAQEELTKNVQTKLVMTNLMLELS